MIPCDPPRKNLLGRLLDLREQSNKFLLFTVWLLAPVQVLAQAKTVDEASSLLDRGEFAQAREVLEKVPTASQTPEYSFLMGKLCFYWGEFDKAADWLEKAAAGNPQSSDCFLWLGRAQGRKAEKASPFKALSLARKARDAFQQAVALDPGNRDAADDLLSYYLDAPGFLGGGKEKAQALAERIKTIRPCQYHMQRAEIHMKEKAFPQAEQELQMAIQAEPQCLKSHIALAHLYQKLGHVSQARVTLHQAVKLFEKSAWVHFVLGRFEVEAGGDLKMASHELEFFFKIYVSGDPYPYEAHYWLGRAFLLMEQPEKAVGQFQYALKALPVHEPSIRGMEEAKRRL